MRKVGPVLRWLYVAATSVTLVSIVVYLLYPYRVIEWLGLDTGYFALLFAFLMPFVFIFFPARGRVREARIPWWDYILAALSFGGFMWIALNISEARDMGWVSSPPGHAAAIAIMLWLLSLEASRRTGGLVFTAVVIVFSLMPYYGFLLPSPFTTQQHPWMRVPATYFMDDLSVFGPATKALARYVLGYMIFGSVIQFLGGGEFLLKVAGILVGGIRGATAKVSIVGSLFFGTLSGSCLANVVTTGSVTIPAMKKSGYKPYYAGAVEACASTGGIIMPPVMGAVAFVMSEITAIPYAEIALAAFIPGLLYYGSIFVQCDIQAVKMGIRPLPKDERPRFSPRLLLDGIDYLISVVILVYGIFALRLEAQAPLFAILPLLVGGIIKRKLRLSNLADLIREVGSLLVTTIALFAGLGLVTGSVLFTGFGMALSSVVLGFGAGNILPLLLLGGLIAIVLGMGISVTAVYILVALLLVPALVKLGLNLMAVHLFVLYYASVAAFTPPVGLAALLASRIADADYMKTGFQAMRLGIVMLIMPLYFVHQPALVLQGVVLEILISSAVALFALVLLCVGFERYSYGVGKLSWPETTAALLGGFLIILPIPSWLTMTGWGLSVVLVLFWVGKYVLTRVRSRASLRQST